MALGYYALFARAPMIEAQSRFHQDCITLTSVFRDAKLDEHGQPKSDYDAHRTLDQPFHRWPRILWIPFSLVTHAAFLLARTLVSPFAADGFSPPYLTASPLPFATAIYGFLGCSWPSVRLARQYVEKTRGAPCHAFHLVGLVSTLPVYMYFNPVVPFPFLLRAGPLPLYWAPHARPRAPSRMG